MTTRVIARIRGGLGNQLFCYAAARRLALVNHAELAIDDVTGFIRDRLYSREFQLDKFNIAARKASPFERMEPFERYRRGLARLIARRKPFHQRAYVEQEGMDFDARLLDFKITGNVYLDGLWQSEGYFKDIEDIIRNDLKIIPPKDPKNQVTCEKINACNAVGVHVRWFNAPNEENGTGNNIEKDYYVRATEEIRLRVPNPHFFLFSDDPGAARDMLPISGDTITNVTHNRGQENACSDIWLMTHCKHFIIANSTFSWWGAWLGETSSSTVVAPGAEIRRGLAAWGFGGLIPDRWIKV